MEQVLHQHVLLHVQEEQNIVQQEHQLVVPYQMDITQQDAIVLETTVQDKVSVLLEHIVLVEYNQHVQEEQNIVQQEQHHVVLYQLDTIQQDAIVLEIIVQDKANVLLEITV